MHRPIEPKTIFSKQQLQEAHLRKPHSCEYHDGNDCFGYCEEENGKLNLVVSDICVSQGMYVPICPFCGYTLKE